MSKGIEHICAQIEAEQKIAADYAAKQNKSDNKPTDEPTNNPADELTNNPADEQLDDINEEVNE